MCAARVRAAAAEDDVVRGADSRAGEQRDHHLGNHRQEDPDDVPLLYVEVLQGVGEALHVAVQVGVGDVALFALLPAPVVSHPVTVARLHVAVHAVIGDVQLTVGEPLEERWVGVIQHSAKWLSQWSCRLWSAQYPSGSCMAASYTSMSRTRACAAVNSAGGSNRSIC
jgi:hypothetical protein